MLSIDSASARHRIEANFILCPRLNAEFRSSVIPYLLPLVNLLSVNYHDALVILADTHAVQVVS